MRDWPSPRDRFGNAFVPGAYITYPQVSSSFLRVHDAIIMGVEKRGKGFRVTVRVREGKKWSKDRYIERIDRATVLVGMTMERMTR